MAIEGDQAPRPVFLEASQTISGELALERLLETIMRLVMETAGADRACLLLPGENGLSLLAEALVDAKKVTVRVRTESPDPEPELPISVISNVRRTRERVVLDAAEPGPFSADTYLSSRRPRSVTCLPILERSELVGLLYAENRSTPEVFTTGRLATLELLAAQAAVSLENAKLYEGLRAENAERKTSEEQLSLLQAITEEVAQAIDLPSAVEVLLRRVCEKTGWVLGQSWIPSEDGSVLECGPAWLDDWGSLGAFRAASEGFTFALGIDLPGRVWSSKRPGWLPDVTLDTNFPRAPFAEQVGLKAGLGLPILVGEDFIAVVEFFMRRPREQDERLVNVIARVAAQLGLPIQRKRAEGAGREAEVRYRTLVEQIPAVTYMKAVVPGDPTRLKPFYISPQAEQILGYSQEEWLAHPESWFTLLHPEDRDEFVATALHSLAAGGPFSVEYRIVRRDGSVAWIREAAVQVTDDRGNPSYWHGFMFDISEAKRTEEALRESEERFAKAFHASPIPMYISRLNDRILLDVNESGLRLLGMERDEYVGHTSVELGLVDQEEFDRIGGALAALRDGGPAQDLESAMRTKSGDRRLVLLSMQLVTLGGEPCVLTAGVDITDRKRAEEERDRLLSRLVTAQEEERRRIASDVHDDSLEVVTAVGMRIAVLRRRLTDKADLADLHRLDEAIATSIDRLRHLSFELHPPTLDREGLGPAINQHLVLSAKDSGFDFRVQDELPFQPSSESRIVCFRIAQEALVNVSKQPAPSTSPSSSRIATTAPTCGSKTTALGSSPPPRKSRCPVTSVCRPCGNGRSSPGDGCASPPTPQREPSLSSGCPVSRSRREPPRGRDRIPPLVRTRARIACYRVAQEALVNVRKHARAERVGVTLADLDQGTYVKIEDDGVGFDPAARESLPGHLGLSAMRERAELADGWWRLSSRPGEGTVVEFWVPGLEERAHAEPSRDLR